MGKNRDSDPRPTCPECGAPLALGYTSSTHYHWDCRVGGCDGSRLLELRQSLSGDCIARDMADKNSAVGLLAKSDDRRKDQAAFRRVASTLDSDHRLFRYLSTGEREAMQTASAALRRLARATETAKDIMARREIREKAERERQDRIDNKQAFDTIIAQSFGRDTILLRCDAMADMLDAVRGFGGGAIRASVSTYRKKLDEGRWTYLVQHTGAVLNEEMFAGKWPHDFEAYWQQWKAGRRYREAVAAAQFKGVRGGDPDA